MNDDEHALERAQAVIIPGELGRKEIFANNKLLVHYTNHACDILKSNELRLRNARNMNDQREIKVGRDCVDAFLKTYSSEFSAALDAIYPSLYNDLLYFWTLEKEAQIDKSFIACFTMQESNDDQGSNYHWKKYGNVALCLDPAFLTYEPSQLSLYLVKVTYGKAAIMAGLKNLVAALKTQRNFLEKIEPGILLSFLRHRLFFESVASKAAKYVNEQEWRLILTPFLFSSADLQPENRQHGENIEEMCLLKMEAPLGTNLTSLATKNLIRKVLIQSKSDVPFQDLRRAIISQLKYRGAGDAGDRVLVVDGYSCQAK